MPVVRTSPEISEAVPDSLLLLVLQPQEISPYIVIHCGHMYSRCVRRSAFRVSSEATRQLLVKADMGKKGEERGQRGERSEGMGERREKKEE